MAGIEDPDRLERLIPTKGWVPVDASIKVSNVSSLVYNLGGEQLYGKDNTIPLRELIQNSIDAIKARRILEIDPRIGEILLYGQEKIRKLIGLRSKIMVLECLQRY